MASSSSCSRSRAISRSSVSMRSASRFAFASLRVVQSALGNLPELFIALFALHRGLVGVVQAALVGSVLANGLLVLGIAFVVGGLKNGAQQFDSPRARVIATLGALGAAILSVPTLAHAFHTAAGDHGRALSFVCAGVLIVLFFLTLPSFLSGGARQALCVTRHALWGESARNA